MERIILGIDPGTIVMGYALLKVEERKPQPMKKKAWVCTVCGYVYEGDEVPEDFLCPLCKHGKEDFAPVDAEPAAAEAKPESSAKTTKWVCTVCGYIHEGDTPPEICPLCKMPAEKFKPLV